MGVRPLSIIHGMPSVAAEAEGAGVKTLPTEGPDTAQCPRMHWDVFGSKKLGLKH